MDRKVCHPRCVYNKLGCVYTCLTQLYGGIDMYNLLHNDQLHVSALIMAFFRLIIENLNHLLSSYTRPM